MSIPEQLQYIYDLPIGSSVLALAVATPGLLLLLWQVLRDRRGR